MSRSVLALQKKALVPLTGKQIHPSVHQKIADIRVGLKFKEVEKLQEILGIPLEKLAQSLGMSRATLHRRKIQGRLDQDESEKLVRYQRLLQRSEDVFGSATNARAWLTHPQTGLGNVVPLDFAATELGAREVENLLGRVEYGVYS